MTTKINISIPQPCHENWQAMTPEDKGRFCESCQKKVFDFTASSDREIVNAYQQNQNLCGRFLNTQLNRDLVKPEKKSSLWLATTTAFISLIGLNEVTAQEPVKTEQRENEILGKVAPPKAENQEIEVSGVVEDKTGSLPGANIIIKGTEKSTQTDFDGKFAVKAKIGDIILVSFVGLEDFEFKVNQLKTYNNIILKELPSSSENIIPTSLGYIRVIKKK